MVDTVQYLKIAGRVYPDNSVRLRNSYVVADPPTRRVRVSEISAEVVDSEGALLVRQLLTMRPYSEDSATFSIRGSVPLPERAARVELWRESDGRRPIRLTVLDLPDTSPEISLLDSPVRAAEGAVVVRWEARGEPAPVEYRVHFSPDDGETWLPVSHRLTATEHEVDFDQLPGGRRARIRVRATNGVRSADVVSGAFRVAIKPCRAIIQQPVDGSEVDPTVTLLGNGWYLEEREPELRALQWESDRDGSLGEGRGLDVTLSPGDHTITLRAGTAGRESAESVRITVRQPTQQRGSGTAASL